MKKIGIAFNDNDFYCTIVPFLELIGQYVREEPKFTKEDIVKLFNNCAGSIYWLSQNGKTYNNNFNEIPKYNYLTIRIDHIYFDDEVDDYVKERDGWDNGEFFYVDVKDNRRDILDSVVQSI